MNNLSTPPQPPSASPAQRPRGYYRWPIIIIALIALQLGLGAVTIYFATRDPSFALVPNAYAKALDWDTQSQARRDSNALGWTSELRVGEPDPMGERYLFLTIRDAAGQPIQSAALEAQAYHQARAAAPLNLSFTPVTPGLYRAKAAMQRDGWWVIHATVQRDQQTFLIDTRTWVGPWSPQ